MTAPQERPIYECMHPHDGSWKNKYKNARVTPPIPDSEQYLRVVGFIIPPERRLSILSDDHVRSPANLQKLVASFSAECKACYDACKADPTLGVEVTMRPPAEYDSVKVSERETSLMQKSILSSLNPSPRPANFWDNSKRTSAESPEAVAVRDEIMKGEGGYRGYKLVL